MDVYEFAMKMELDGKKYYTDLMEQSDNKGVRAIFNIVAQEEEAHYNILKGLKNDVELHSESRVLDVAKNVFEIMFENKDKEKCNISREAILHALNLEKDSIKFYEEQVTKSQSQNDKQAFAKLLKEEEKHYTVLENLLDHISGGFLNGLVAAEFQQLLEEEDA